MCVWLPARCSGRGIFSSTGNNSNVHRFRKNEATDNNLPPSPPHPLHHPSEPPTQTPLIPPGRTRPFRRANALLPPHFRSLPVHRPTRRALPSPPSALQRRPASKNPNPHLRPNDPAIALRSRRTRNPRHQILPRRHLRGILGVNASRRALRQPPLGAIKAGRYRPGN